VDSTTQWRRVRSSSSSSSSSSSKGGGGGGGGEQTTTLNTAQEPQSTLAVGQVALAGGGAIFLCHRSRHGIALCRKHLPTAEAVTAVHPIPDPAQQLNANTDHVITSHPSPQLSSRSGMAALMQASAVLPASGDVATASPPAAVKLLVMASTPGATRSTSLRSTRKRTLLSR